MPSDKKDGAFHGVPEACRTARAEHPCPYSGFMIPHFLFRCKRFPLFSRFRFCPAQFRERPLLSCLPDFPFPMRFSRTRRYLPTLNRFSKLLYHILSCCAAALFISRRKIVNPCFGGEVVRVDRTPLIHGSVQLSVRGFCIQRKFIFSSLPTRSRGRKQVRSDRRR